MAIAILDKDMHVFPQLLASRLGGEQYERERTPNYWVQTAQQTLKDRIKKKLNTSKHNAVYNSCLRLYNDVLLFTDIAKNIILFLGDGMSIPTLAATRIYLSQIRNQSGTEQSLSFDLFPYSGLSKVANNSVYLIA